MQCRGSVHIVRYENSKYNTMFSRTMLKRHLEKGPQKARRFTGIDPVTKFLERDMGIRRDLVDEAVLRLHIEGHVSIQNVDTSEGDLRRLGLLG